MFWFKKKEKPLYGYALIHITNRGCSSSISKEELLPILEELNLGYVSTIKTWNFYSDLHVVTGLGFKGSVDTPVSKLEMFVVSRVYNPTYKMKPISDLKDPVIDEYTKLEEIL